jgi:hypothetical protein
VAFPPCELLRQAAAFYLIGGDLHMFNVVVVVCRKSGKQIRRAASAESALEMLALDERVGG